MGEGCRPHPTPPLLLDLLTHKLLMMLGMLVRHAGDVENDAGDVREKML